MALTIALPLSGLEPEQFGALSARLLFGRDLKELAGSGPASPSTGSETSGVSSFAPSVVESTTPALSPISSRPGTPTQETCKEEEKTEPAKVLYKNRDILNLGANIREPFWQMRSASMPRFNFRAFMENRSIYYRLGDHGLTEEYPTRNCKECGFSEPSPYLF